MTVFLKRGLLIAFALLLAGIAGASVPISPVVEQPAKAVAGDEPVHATGVPGPYAFSSELDELMGDTIAVGTTWRDMQHNGTIGRMIGLDMSDPENPEVKVVWCYRSSADGTSQVRYTNVFFDDDGNPQVELFNGYREDTNWGAYNVIYVDQETGTPLIAFHGPSDDAAYTYSSILGAETIFLPGFFTLYYIPHYPDVEGLWPHMDIGRYNETLYLHTIINGYDTNDNNLYYHRAIYDPVTSTFSNATPGDVEQLFITDVAMNLSGTVAVSHDGSKVTIGQTVSRWLMGEGPPTWEGLALSQQNNDIYLWTSTDGGETWDWDSPVNITNWIAPDESYFPDSLAADRDTMRAYTEIELMYDEDDVLHAAFNTPNFYFWEEVTTYTDRLFYWNDDTEEYTMIADGTFWNYARPGVWERVVGHCNLYKDEETGVLWAMWQQYGEPGDTIVVDDQVMGSDASDDAYANADIFVSASPDNGRHWAKSVNITDTKGTTGQLAAGECRSEREPSLSPNNDGDYLHIFYTLDMDAGVAVPAGNEAEGEPTENLQIYHRVSKADLIAQFETNAEWVRNYPMHVDSSGFYQDPNDWAWNGFWIDAVDDGGEALLPDQFDLEQNYPNPFNPSTHIGFTLRQAGKVKLAVYDVLGREVAVLVNRGLSAGRHEVTFRSDDLPSGVYFYKLSSGESSRVRKMVVLK